MAGTLTSYIGTTYFTENSLTDITKFHWKRSGPTSKSAHAAHYWIQSNSTLPTPEMTNFLRLVPVLIDYSLRMLEWKNESDTVKSPFTDTRLIQTPHYYGKFVLSQGKESPYIFSKFNRVCLYMENQYTATKDSLREKNYAQTNTFKFSFFNRIVDMWNWLPFHVRSASSISSLW